MNVAEKKIISTKMAKRDCCRNLLVPNTLHENSQGNRHTNYGFNGLRGKGGEN